MATAMEQYFVSTFSVRNLWGYKNYPIVFHDDVNVIIGPNASGKTTLINILFDTLSGNFPRLCRTDFAEVIIKLKAFDGNTQRDLRFLKTDEDLQIVIDNDTHTIPLAPFVRFGDNFDYSELDVASIRRRRKTAGTNIPKIQQQLRGLVPAVWLPVSRRLPIAEEEEFEQRRLHRKPLESVDECLSGLADSLQQYRLGLNTELSELRREFQRHALENILYDKQHDRALLDPKSFTPPSEHDKQALLKAFQDVGLVDRRMEKRIDDHFAAANDAASKLSKRADGIDIKTIFIIPLINRTRAIVEFAQQLENQREDLFAALHAFESIVNSFLSDKNVAVADRGDLVISPERRDARPIDWRHLSSGEKQILILLIQALLSEKTPVVYVADEPELSLHVDWQEKLLGALTRLAGRCQFIVATHSPDIASGFGQKVIDLARFK